MHRAQRASPRRSRPAASPPASAGTARWAASALSGSRAAPGEGRGGVEIPNRGDPRANQPGGPVFHRIHVQPVGDRDVDDGADAASKGIAQEAAPDPSAAKALGAV